MDRGASRSCGGTRLSSGFERFAGCADGDPDVPEARLRGGGGACSQPSPTPVTSSSRTSLWIEGVDTISNRLRRWPGSRDDHVTRDRVQGPFGPTRPETSGRPWKRSLPPSPSGRQPRGIGDFHGEPDRTPPPWKGIAMTLSDDLTKLAARAKRRRTALLPQRRPRHTPSCSMRSSARGARSNRAPNSCATPPRRTRERLPTGGRASRRAGTTRSCRSVATSRRSVRSTT